VLFVNSERCPRLIVNVVLLACSTHCHSDSCDGH